MKKEGNTISRRDFLKGSAAGALGVAAAGIFGSSFAMAEESETEALTEAATEAAAEEAASASGTITWDDIFATSYSQANRGSDPDAKAPESPEEYIEQKGNGDISGSMMVGMVDPLGISESQFMNNKPAWLGDEPDLSDKVTEVKECDVLVIGSGQAGTSATLHCADQGLNVICCEVQTWDEYDNYACDLAMYNSNFFLEKGAEKYDPMEIFNEYMLKALGHANQQIVKDYAQHSGEVLDWALSYLDSDYVEKYAHAVNYKGNANYQNPCNGSNYYTAMCQWRDTGTETNSNNNMWPYTVRLLQQKAVELGAEYIYGAQGLTLVHSDGQVTGAIFTDIDGNYFQVNAQAVIVAAGDFGGNPDMRLDLCDTLRNLAWSYGLDRTDPNNISSMGRDGSGIRMMLWAGATMEAGPRAGQAAGINSKPSFPFGGCWPVFGDDGKRFFNETLTKHGSIGYLDMMPAGLKMSIVTDANWDEYCEYQSYGHEVMDRSNDYMIEKVRDDMANYVTGPDGFSVQAFARYGNDPSTVYAADTLDELADILGYEGDAKQGFLDEIEHWNEMCDAGVDSDWGADSSMMHFKIEKAPFFGATAVTGGNPSGGLCQHAAVCTDGEYRVLDASKTPIPGLYAVGNCCGQRYGIQYHTPTAGNSCGSAFTTGYMAADYLKGHLEAGIGTTEAETEERSTNGIYYAGTYSSSQNTGYSTVTVTMEFSEDAIIGCTIASSGDQDLLTSDSKEAMAAAILEAQSVDVDAVSSSTLSFSVQAIQDAVADCIAQATA
ncbi:MAG: FAD-binding protein [Clostridiales bacterium]|nr:FAD-binding protein [Clostridiales bacterium]